MIVFAVFGMVAQVVLCLGSVLLAWRDERNRLEVVPLWLVWLAQLVLAVGMITQMVVGR